MNIEIKKIIFLVAFLLLSSSCNKQVKIPEQAPPLKYNYTHNLKIGSQFLKVEIAKSQSELEHGLSNRARMKEAEGMLFDFGTTSATPAFWMKDMQFNLDIIWIYKNKIVGITDNVPTPTCNSSLETCHLQTYSPPSPITQVLEVNAGWSKKNNIKVGDDIILIN